MVFLWLFLSSGGVKIALFTGKFVNVTNIGDYFHFPSLDVLLDIINYG